MKILKQPFLLILIIPFFLGCQGEPGPVGPRGPQGPQGLDGVNVVGLMYEIDFDLNASNGWSNIYKFPVEDEIYWSDVVLVYKWMGKENGNNIWRLMPINYYDDRGVSSINFDFSAVDVNIFAEASFTFNPDIDHFNGEAARIVIVPAAESTNQRKGFVDYENFEAVKAAFGLKEAKKLKPLK